MSSITAETGLTVEKLQQVADLVKRAGEEAVQLRIVERFLSEVERRLLKTSPVIFDIERVRTALQILKTINEEDDIEECLEAEFRLDQEFHLWRKLITDRDRGIETYHFRRLCDSTSQPLDDEIFIALASFYRSLDFSPAGQSKFDLAVTRLFSKADGSERRELRATRSEMIARLKRLFDRPGQSHRSTEDIEYAFSAIDGFTDEAKHLGNFEDLVRSNIFDRYRIFKRELGSLFFEAEIVAAAIECNVTVGNVFNDLLRAADEQLSTRLTVDIDLPSALHDASPEARTHINELFRVFFGESDATDPDAGEDVDSSTLPENSSNDRQPHQTNSVQSRLAPFLSTLTQARPDADLLMKQMHRSESLKNVDINDFLYHKNGSPDVLCRRALGLILWSLEFRETDLRQKKELTEEIQREATALLYKAEHLANSLQTEIEASDDENENRLRSVLNSLLDSRLRLERAIVRFTNKKMAASEETAPKTDAPMPQAPQKKRGVFGVFTRWLIITLVLGTIAGGTLFYLNKQFDLVLTSANGFGNVDVRTLPQSEFMRSAYRHDHTLFINAHDTWKKRSSEDREQTLRTILEDPKQARIQTVVIMGEEGDVVESKSRSALVSDYGNPEAFLNKVNQ
jgi:hypothetical protein